MSNRFVDDRPRRVLPPKNPLIDPIAHYKQPLTGAHRGKAKVEFSPHDIRMIRAKFCATQREFAALIGVSRETLRNWEEGRRRPHGPGRALLRAIDADPVALARALNWYTRAFEDKYEDWINS